MDGTVLVADDDRTIRTVLTQALTRAGCKVHATSSMVTLRRWISEGLGDLVISDVVMPDGNGLEHLPQIRRARPDLPVIIISAQNTIMTAFQATERDAYDYLPKPFDLPDLMHRAAKAMETKSPGGVGPALEVPDTQLPLIGQTPVMQSLYQLVARVLNVDMPVLITGGSGVGKSLIAKIIHDFSDRSAQPFVVCGPGQMCTNDAAQAVVGRAQRGTVLLDRIEDFDDQMQAQVIYLLDTVADGSVRVLSTGSQHLGQKVNDGHFREDLYYRLNGFGLTVPALRDRIDDIPHLASHFMATAGSIGQPVKSLSDAALEKLRRYSWPGNVRQLENAVLRLCLTCSDYGISEADVMFYLESQPAYETHRPAGQERLRDSIGTHLQRYFDLHGEVLPPPGLYGRILKELEVPLIEISLDAVGGNQAKCADLLGINRNTLRKKLTELDIRVTRRRKLM